MGKHKNTWFLKDTVQNTIKVQATPGSTLATAVKKALGDQLGTEGGTTKVVELGGMSITSGLSGQVGPTGDSGCFYPTKCHTDKRCGTSKVVYEVVCKTCGEENPTVYIGTSGQSMHRRQITHQQAIRSRSERNALSLHHLQNHTGEDPNFTAKILRGPMRYNHERFVLEAVKIQESNRNPNINTLNQRGEWGYRGLARLQIAA